MDNPTKTSSAKDLQPPQESGTSVVLNSVGNGMMLGAIPFLAFEVKAAVTKTPLSPALTIASIAATGVGGVLGWVFGEKEAKALQDYRQNLATEVTALRGEVEQLKQEKRSWQTRVSASQDMSEDQSVTPISL